MARTRNREDEIDTPPLANTVFAGEQAAANLAEQGITGPANAIALAKKLKAKGASRDQIHRATSKLLDGTPYAGVVFGPNDGKPKFEISDDTAKLRPKSIPRYTSVPLDAVLDHPELYRALPSTGMATVERSISRDSWYDGDRIGIGEQHIPLTPDGKKQIVNPSAKGPLLHEVQHVIQGREKFNGGGSPSDFPGVSPEMQKALYTSIDGENEAEMVRKRADMTPEQRRANPPKPGVPWSEQIDVEAHLKGGKQALLGDLADVAIDTWKRVTTREVVEGRPIHQRRLDPRRVAADPETFQFKSGGDSHGVTDRLKGVNTWDPLAAGKQIVYQRANGEYVIADGHQRRGLALRAIQKGQTDVALDAFVLREKDGWTPRDVRAYAALKNIKESSGNALDMAKVMRERPDLAAKSLPMSDAKIRDAVALSKLSAPAFDLVEAGVIKPEHAAAVGAQVKDSARHADMLGEMAKAGMRSAEHARLYVSQAMAAPSISETTGSLFGDETKVRSLLAERARVLDRALSSLKSDKRIFALLERESANIEAAGNRLAHGANVERADTAGRLAELVERLSTTRGPVSEMLDKAALAMAEGKPPAQAARAFVTDVGKVMQSGGVNALLGDAAPPSMSAPVDPNQGNMFGEIANPAGWSDEARAASAEVRKGKAKGKGKQPKARGRKQMMVEDGSPKPTKDIRPEFAKGQFALADMGRSLAFSDGWKAAKSGRRLAAGVDPDFAAGYRQYQMDKSPRAAERAMIQHLSKDGGVHILGNNTVTLAGSTMPEKGKPANVNPSWSAHGSETAAERDARIAAREAQQAEARTHYDQMHEMEQKRQAAMKAQKGQTSFLPEPTTKEQIAAAAKSAGKPSAAQVPMDDGMFGSGVNQTDLVDAIKQKQNLPAPSQIDRHAAALTQTENAGVRPVTPEDVARENARREAARQAKPYTPPAPHGPLEDGTGKPAGWSDEARAASAQSRKENAMPNEPAKVSPAVRKAFKSVFGHDIPKHLSRDDVLASLENVEPAPGRKADRALAAAQKAVAAERAKGQPKAPKMVTADDFDFSKAPRYRKTATIRADQVQVAKGGEEVITRQPSKDGGTFVETKNVAKPGDRIVTRSPGDSYVISGEKFPKLYEADPNNPGVHRSANSGRAIRVKQDVQIKVKWSTGQEEIQTIKKGGVIFKSDLDGSVYGNQKNTFDTDFQRVMKNERSVNFLGKGDKYGKGKSAAQPAPAKFGIVPTAQREGLEGLRKALARMSPEALRAMASEQGFVIPKKTTDVHGEVAKAAFNRMAERTAAAGGDPSKFRALAEEAGKGLRGTQNPENLKAIVEGKKARAKGGKAPTPKQQTAAAYQEAFGKAPPARMTAKAMRDSVANVRTRIGQQDAMMDRLLVGDKPAQSGKPRKQMMIDPESLHGRQAPGFNQTMDRLLKHAEASAKPTIDQPSRADVIGRKFPPFNEAMAKMLDANAPTAKPSLGARAASAFNTAGTVGLGVGVAAAAVMAANQSAAAGESVGKQAAAAGTAAAVAAAPAAVIGGGMYAAAKLSTTAAKFVPGVGWAIAGGAAAYGAVTEGVKAAREGKSAGGIAKAAGWGAVNTVVPIDAALEAARSVRGRMAAPKSDRMGEFARANDAWKRQQAMNTTQTDHDSARKPGWGPEARIAAAKARGAVALPYGGDATKAPGYVPPEALRRNG